MRVNRGNRLCPLIAAIAIIFALIRAGSTIGVFNDTVDEPFHIGAAVTLLETGRLVHGTETPPVARLVQGVALKLAGVRTTALVPDRTIRDNRHAFAVGGEILVRGPVPYWRVLAFARGATLTFIAVALLYVYLLGRWAGGPFAGMFATLFCSTDPTLLAHGALATSDAAAAAGFVAASYHLLRWIRLPDLTRAIIAGFATGLAVGAKFSCLALGPIMLMLMAWRLWTARRRQLDDRVKIRRGLLRGFAVVCFVGFISLWACYLFDIGPMTESEMLTTGRWARMNSRLTQTPIPMPSLPLGLLILQRHDVAQHPAYLFGAVRNGGWWYYFPVALILKSPTALVIGCIVAAGLALARVGARTRRARFTFALLVPVIGLLAISMKSNIQIGVRYMLPLLPLLYVFVALQLCRKRWSIALIVLIVGSFIETIARHPDYLSFHNLPTRMLTRDAPPPLIDSNLDWGQDIARAAAWMKANHPNTPYETRLFCSDAAARIFGLGVDVKMSRTRGLLLVSKNVRYGLYTAYDVRATTQPTAPLLPDVIRRSKPTAQIGDSIEVYDLRE